MLEQLFHTNVNKTSQCGLKGQQTNDFAGRKAKGTGTNQKIWWHLLRVEDHEQQEHCIKGNSKLQTVRGSLQRISEMQNYIGPMMKQPLKRSPCSSPTEAGHQNIYSNRLKRLPVAKNAIGFAFTERPVPWNLCPTWWENHHHRTLYKKNSWHVEQARTPFQAKGTFKIYLKVVLTFRNLSKDHDRVQPTQTWGRSETKSQKDQLLMHGSHKLQLLLLSKSAPNRGFNTEVKMYELTLCKKSYELKEVSHSGGRTKEVKSI